MAVRLHYPWQQKMNDNSVYLCNGSLNNACNRDEESCLYHTQGMKDIFGTLVLHLDLHASRFWGYQVQTDTSKPGKDIFDYHGCLCHND